MAEHSCRIGDEVSYTIRKPRRRIPMGLCVAISHIHTDCLLYIQRLFQVLNHNTKRFQAGVVLVVGL